METRVWIQKPWVQLFVASAALKIALMRIMHYSLLKYHWSHTGAINQIWVKTESQAWSCCAFVQVKWQIEDVFMMYAAKCRILWSHLHKNACTVWNRRADLTSFDRKSDRTKNRSLWDIYSTLYCKKVVLDFNHFLKSQCFNTRQPTHL